jgi:hypothetical protein
MLLQELFQIGHAKEKSDAIVTVFTMIFVVIFRKKYFCSIPILQCFAAMQ